MKKNRISVREKRLRWLGVWVLLALLAAMCALLVYTTFILDSRHQALKVSTEEYISWTEKATTVHEATDYLTEQARLFVQTQKRVYMDRYFEEVNVTKRREAVMDALSGHYSHKTITAFLENAVAESNRLMEQEYYAMRLVCAAMEFEEEALPVELRQTVLSAEDAALSAEEMLEKGYWLMYDENYQSSKALIYDGINQFVQGAVAEMNAQRQVKEESVSRAFRTQRIVMWAQVALVAAVVLTLLLRLKKQTERNRQSDMWLGARMGRDEGSTER